MDLKKKNIFEEPSKKLSKYYVNTNTKTINLNSGTFINLEDNFSETIEQN